MADNILPPIANLEGRQAILSAYFLVMLADFTNRGNVVDLKVAPGSEIIGGAINVTEAFNSGTTDVLSVGDPTLTTRYLNAQSIAAVGRTAIVPTGKVHTVGDQVIRLTRVPTGTAATTGQVRVRIDYVKINKADHTQD